MNVNVNKYLLLKLINANNVFIFLVISSIIFYSLYDTLVFRVTTTQRIIGGIILLISVLVATINLSFESKDRHTYKACGILIIFSIIGIFSAFLNNDLHVEWFLSDITVWTLLCSFIIIFSTIRTRQQVSMVLVAMVVAFWLCGLSGFLWGERVNERFEAPALFVVSGLPLLLVYARTHVLLLGIPANVLTGYLCLASGDRTAMLLWCFFTMISACYWSYKLGLSVITLHRLVFLLCISGLVFLNSGRISELQDSFIRTTRVYKTTTSGPLKGGHADQSLATRVDEVRDSFDHMRATHSVLRYFFGFGHGAAFFTELADKNTQNMDRAGMMHNIHFSPMLIFFRYGLFGVFIYMIFFIRILITFAGIIMRSERDGDCNALVLSGILLSYLASGFMRNEFANPLFLLTIALYLTQAHGLEFLVVTYDETRQTA